MQAPVHPAALAAVSTAVEGWRQAGELGFALLLSAAMGLEREVRQKSAGLRTHTLVGVGAALFMLVSKYGCGDVLEPGRVILDPSRVAAQIVTGVGFLGAGIIFVRKDSVRGLTTAPAIWITAGVGAAAGAGLPIPACLTTGIYLSRGILRQLLAVATDLGFAIDEASTESRSRRSGTRASGEPSEIAQAEVTLQVHGKASISELTSVLSETGGVDAVEATDANATDE